VSRVVVIVDDDADIREIATLSLEMVQGWTVVPVASGAEAVEVVARLGPDAVLLDVMMPGQDGPATLAALRAQESTRAVPVVFLTAKAQLRERAELEGLGAAGVLAKPFDAMTLGAEFAAVLGWEL
jgi:CheY-like chemotaxis protein